MIASLDNSGIDIEELTRSLGDDILKAYQNNPHYQKNYVQARLAAPGLISWTTRPMAIAAMTPVYSSFYNLVDTGKPVDLKNRIINDQYPYSAWSLPWQVDVDGDGESDERADYSGDPNKSTDKSKQNGDYLGNYLFGYVGQAFLPYAGPVLKAGAGAAQGISDIGDRGIIGSILKYADSIFVGNWGDNYGDADKIQRGIDDYEEDD